MKIVIPLLMATAAAGGAHAQDLTPSIYGSLGYAERLQENLGVVQLRLGARFGDYIGVEGELANGVKSDSDRAPGFETSVRHEAGAFAVAYLPLTSKADLFARVGYGKTWFSGRNSDSSLGPTHFRYDDKTLKLGLGAQYFFDERNGVRLDYVRQDATRRLGKLDSWGLAYTRRF